MGTEQGVADLASWSARVARAYCDQVIAQQFLRTGACSGTFSVQYLGDGCSSTPLTASVPWPIRQNRRRHYLKTSVPGLRRVKFQVLNAGGAVHAAE